MDTSELAHKQILSELKLIDKRIDHPELFFSYDKHSIHSPIHWGGTQTELKELLTTLELEGVILDSNNTKASFTDIVKTFEQMLNISIGDAKYIKRDILRRNTKRTIFIDRLKRSLLNNEV